MIVTDRQDRILGCIEGRFDLRPGDVFRYADIDRDVIFSPDASLDSRIVTRDFLVKSIRFSVRIDAMLHAHESHRVGSLMPIVAQDPRFRTLFSMVPEKHINLKMDHDQASYDYIVTATVPAIQVESGSEEAEFLFDLSSFTPA